MPEPTYRAVICVEFSRDEGYDPNDTAQEMANDLANSLGRGFNVWLDDVSSEEIDDV